jgi:hypothetical protein
MREATLSGVEHWPSSIHVQRLAAAASSDSISWPASQQMPVEAVSCKSHGCWPCNGASQLLARCSHHFQLGILPSSEPLVGAAAAARTVLLQRPVRDKEYFKAERCHKLQPQTKPATASTTTAPS